MSFYLFWFSLGVLAYNSFIMKKNLILPEEFMTKTIQSIRWILIEVAGKVVKHARRLSLKLYADMEKFVNLRRIRLRCAELSG